MTTLYQRALQCSVCKKISRHTEIGSSNSFGACDLDTRPPEMMRSTMPQWVQTCPHCGYVASKVTDKTQQTADFFKSESFVSCDGIDFKSDLARNFYRLYLVKRADGDVQNAYWSILEAAWDCDDAGDSENAVVCRKLALRQLETLIENAKDAPQDNLCVMKLDILRRAGMFEEVGQYYKTLNLSEALLKKIAAFEVIRSDAKDARRYTVDDVAQKTIVL